MGIDKRTWPGGHDPPWPGRFIVGCEFRGNCNFDDQRTAQRCPATQRVTGRNRLPEEASGAVWIKGQIEDEVSGHQSQDAHVQKGEHEQDDAGPSLIPKQAELRDLQRFAVHLFVVTLILHGVPPSSPSFISLT
jgi:hypothetical protein